MSDKTFSADEFLNQFLGGTTEEPGLILPTGESFVNVYIGPIMAAVKWSFWSPVDLDKIDSPFSDEPEAAPYSKRGREGSYFYYFDDRDVAREYAKIVDAIRPGQVWRFEMATDQVLWSTVQSLDEWGSTVGGDCRISTARSTKHRHEFNLMCLPAAVNALAVRVGLDTQFPLDDLYLTDTDAFTDEFSATMIGGEYGADGEMVKVDWKDSVLFERRKTLWSRLGEGNPLAQNHTGTGTSIDVTEKAPALNQCLGILTRPWVRPVFGKLVMVPDPRVDAVYVSKSSGMTTRLTVPCLVMIYRDEEEAQAAAAEAKGDGNGNEPAVPAKKKASAEAAPSLPIPTAWADYPADWVEEIKKRKAEKEGKALPKPLLIKTAEELGCSAKELLAWWDAV